MIPLRCAYLVEQVVFAAGSLDPVSSQMGRDGLSSRTVEDLSRVASAPAVRYWFGWLARPDVTESDVMRLLLMLTSRRGVPDGEAPDLAAFVASLASRGQDADPLARALAGLLALGFLEGLARAHRPLAEYPYFALDAISDIVLPVADLLCAADMLGGAAMLGALVRSYILADPFQRNSPKGRVLAQRCRALERRYAAERRVACQEAAWKLHERAGDDPVVRAGLATVLFASGDVVRAYALARNEHLPGVAALTDLVELSLDLAPVDPLLQATWLHCVDTDLPERVALPLRMRRRDINGAFKGYAEAIRSTQGVDLSEAYARLLFGFVNGLWRDPQFEDAAWSAVTTALQLPTPWEDYRNGFVRIMDLVSLAFDAESPVPASEFVLAMSGRGAPADSDIRSVASASLSMDGETGRRGQYGRSLAYDSPFLLEPWRREEDVLTSIDILERHRAAGMEYWLRSVPPFTPPAKTGKQRRIIERDSTLTVQFQSLTFAATLAESAVHHRIYGDGKRRRVLQVDEAERMTQLQAWHTAQARWVRDAERDFPRYAAVRARPAAWTVEGVQRFLSEGTL